MTRAIVPVADLAPRIPDAGRLRFGTKKQTQGGKDYPAAIAEWRLTSHDKEAIEQIAAIYGGEPRPWRDAPTPGQWEVYTTSSELRIVLPPDPLGGSPIYELWSGGGCQRRCDGVTCTTIVQGADGAEPGEVPCICDANGVLNCTIKTRLSIILPEVKFAGVWRLDSGSWNVAHEFPGMVAMIQSLQARGMTRALLGLEHRKIETTEKCRKCKGKGCGDCRNSGRKPITKRFIVPTLRIADSPNAILEGAARVGALASGAQVIQAQAPALGAGVVPDSSSLEVAAAAGEYDVEGEVVDAEVIDVPAVPPGGAAPEQAGSPPSPPAPPADEPPPPTEAGDPRARLLRRFHASLNEAYAVPEWVEHKTQVRDEARHTLLAGYRVTSSKDLEDDVLERIIKACKEQPAQVRVKSGLPEQWGTGP